MARKSNWPSESRHQRGYGTTWDKLRLQVLERDGHLCQCSYCKADDRTTVATEVDHVVSKANARALGWTQARIEHPDNLQAINSTCHERKTIDEQGKSLRRRVRIGMDGFPVG